MLPLILAAAAACPYPAAAPVHLASRHEMPAGAVAAFGALAEKGEPFQVTDVIMPGPRRPFSRFVSATGQGCTITLHYEHGGIAHSWPTARLTFADGRWTLVSRY